MISFAETDSCLATVSIGGSANNQTVIDLVNRIVSVIDTTLIGKSPDRVRHYVLD